MKDSFLFSVKAAVGLVVGFFLGLHPLMRALVYFMGLDILTGLAAGWVTKEISSDVSRRGMVKKALVWVLIGTVEIATRHTDFGFPAASIVAGFFCAHEVVSIVENCGRAGVPLGPVRNVLAKMKTMTTDESPKAG